jgi:hypothetical protein
MKKILFLGLILFLFVEDGYSQLFTFTFNGTGTCPTQGNSLSPQPSNVTVSALSRTGAITCNSSDNVFNTSNWSLNTAVDGTQYIEFTVSANTGYVVNLNSVSFVTQRSATGPVNGRVSNDGGSGSFTSVYDYTVGTTNSTVNWDFVNFSTSDGGTVRFRIYGWNATGTTGTMRIDDLALYATVTQAGANTTWLLDGNAEVSEKKLGTINSYDLPFITNNIENMRLSAGGNLGIGVNNPVAKLHIYKSGIGTSQSDANGILLQNNTAATASVTQLSPPIVLAGQGWKTDAAAGSQEVKYKIDAVPVNGTSGVLGTFRIQRSFNGAAYTDVFSVDNPPQVNGTNMKLNGGLILGSASGSNILYSSSIGTGFYNQSGSVSNMYITQAGQVMIGGNVITPQASVQLEIASTTRGFLPPRMTTTQRNAISSPATGLEIYNTTTNTKDIYNGSSWLNLTTSNALASTTWGAAGNTGTNPAINFIGTSDAQRLVFKTNNTEAATILANGNMGIGTTAPTEKLEVAGRVKANGFILPGTDAVDNNVLVSTTVNGVAGVAAWRPFPSLPISNSFWKTTGNSGTNASTNFIGTADATDLVIRTEGNEIGRFSGSGNRAISFQGSNATGQSSFAISGGSATGENSVALINSSASGVNSFALNAAIASGDNSFALHGGTASGIYSFAMADGAQASGDYSFAIGGGTASGVYSFASASSSASGIMSVAMGRGQATGENSFAIGDNVQANGNFSTAIGVSSVASGNAATAIGGGVIAGGNYSTALGFYTNAGGENSTALGFYTKSEAVYSSALGSYNVGGGNPTAWILTDPLFEIGNGTSESNRSNALTIFKNGNVGIGTTDTKGYKLAVNGDIIAEKLKIKPYANWSDFVFDPGYKLPTLAAVESFIQQYKHLPDVPSASDVVKDGIEVGSNQAILLQKVEELTLYIIAQHKKSELQEQVISVQSKTALSQQDQINNLQHQLDELKALVRMPATKK